MSTLTAIHPRQALFGSEHRPPTLPVCDHYAGVEARMRKSIVLQAEMADEPERAVFDVTLDLPANWRTPREVLERPHPVVARSRAHCSN